MTRVLPEVTVYAGPMGAGKTTRLYGKMGELTHLGIPYEAYRPGVDVRDVVIAPRGYVVSANAALTPNCTFVTCMTRLCLRSLHHRFILWTKPDTTSLIPGMLIDQARNKSELVAENAFLRQQLIILRRQVKQLACAKTDRMLLLLLARMVRTWKQALFLVQEDDALARAAPGLQTLLEVQVQSILFSTQDLR